MYMVNVKRKLALSFIGTLLVLALLIGFSYSMFTAQIVTNNKTETAIKTAEKGLIYTGQSDIDETGIFPGDSFEKTFTVENRTSEEEWYNIYMEDITNDYNEDLVYTLYETDSTYENGISTVVSEKVLPETKEGKSYLKVKLTIDAQPKIQYYKMVITYKDREEAQPYNSNAKFEGTVGIDQEDVEEDAPVIDPENEYTITVNPNGGLYEESLDIQTIVKHGGETYSVSIPTRVGHTFNGWEVSDNFSYENDVVTVYNRDVTLKAKWTLTDDAVAVAQIVRTETKYGSIQEAEDAAENNDTIRILKNTSEVFSNSKTLTIDFDDHTVSGKLSNTGNITLINGTLRNVNDYAINNTGTLTLGVKDNNVDIDDIAIITDRDHNAIKQDGTMNFYDGYAEGLVAIVGSVSNVPDPITVDGVLKRYYVLIEKKSIGEGDEETKWQKAYVALQPNAIAKRIDGTEMFYYDLQNAVDSSMASGKTIYAIKDFDATKTVIRADSSHDIVFDIAGFNVRLGDTFTNNKNLTITDSGRIDEQTQEPTRGVLLPSKTIINNGNLLIKDIVVTAQQDYNIIDNTGILTVENSTITANNAYAISNASSGTISLDNDTYLYATNYALYNNSQEEVTISAGSINGINNGGNLKLTNGVKVFKTVVNDTYVIYNTGTLTTNGIEITSNSRGINVVGGTVNFDGDITAPLYCFYIDGGTLNVNGGNVESTGGYTIGLNGGATVINGSNISSSTTVFYGLGGTLTINGGKIESKGGTGTAIDRRSSGVTITNGEIIGTKTGAEAFVTMSGGTLRGGQYGIDGSGNITGGTVIGGTYGIKTKNSFGSVVTLGTDGDETPLSVPVIQGETYGIYIDSGMVVNFYDGLLKGKTAGYNGVISAVPEGTFIDQRNEESGDSEHPYVTNYLNIQSDFLRVNGVTYNSFTKAMQVASDSDVIEVIDDASVKKELTIPSGKTVTIDMNNHIIAMSKSITNNGTLNIIDNSVSKNGTINFDGTTNFIENTSTLTINDITINKTSSGDKWVINNTGTLTATGVEITSSSYGIQTSGTTNFNGNITAPQYCFNTTGGINNINGGNITATSNYTIRLTDGNTNINGGNIISPSIVFYKFSNLNITGGRMESTGGTGLVVDHRSGTLTISGGELISTKIAVKGSITTMSGGTLRGGQYGLEGSGTITSGTIIGGTYGINATTSYGNTVILGIDAENDPESMPVIQGETYGIYVNSGVTVNFYDGELRGKSNGYAGVISAIPDGTLIADKTLASDDPDHPYKVKYLDKQVDFLRVNGVTYNSFNKALQAVGNSGTIEVIYDAVVKVEVTIPSEKTVTLDMNDHTITMSKSIVNNGTLSIIDDSTNKNGTLNFDGTTNFIENTSTMTISDISINKISAGDKYVINNTGNLTATGVDITSSSYGISIAGGTVNYSGDLTAPQYNFHTRTGTLNLSSGTITSTSGYTFKLDGGQTNVNGGNITSPTTVFYKFANLNITGGRMESTGGTGLVVDHRSGTLTISGGELIATKIAVQGTITTMSGGTLRGGQYGLDGSGTITGGTVIGGTYGILDTNTVTIGENDNGTPASVPVIQGDSYGIYVNSGKTLNFYDGILRGQVEAHYGGINNIPSNKQVEYYIDTIDGVDYSGARIIAETNIIRNTTTLDEFINLQDAIGDATSGDTLLLLKDSAIYYDVTNSKDITLDLDNHKLLTSKEIINNGTLSVVDNSSNKGGKLYTKSAVSVIKNNATLNISNIALENNYTDSNIIINQAYGTATLTNVTINTRVGSKNASNGVINFQNCNMTTQSTALNSDGKYTISGGSINGKGNVIYDSSYEENSIQNLNLISDSTALYMRRQADISITGSDLTGSIINTSETSDIVIDSTDIQGKLSNSYGEVIIRNNSSIEIDGYGDTVIINNSKLTISDSTVKYTAYDTGWDIASRLIVNSGTLNIDNSDLELTNNKLRYTSFMAIESSGGSIKFKDSDIVINSPSSWYKTYGYGIYAAGNTILDYDNSNITINNTDFGYGIYIDSSNATANTIEGDITLSSTLDNPGYSECTQYGIYANSGKIVTKSSNISATSSHVGYGIYINSGNITLGEEEPENSPNKRTANATVSTTSPFVSGVGTTIGNGIRNVNGVFNYYDGRLEGSTHAKPDAATDREDLYVEKYENDNKACYLIYSPSS